MAIAFNQTNGERKKGSADYYQYKMGDNAVRLIGGVLPRYMYWVKPAEGGNNVPFECLSFNRETEVFDNKETDYVQEALPDLRCSWAYTMLCIADGAIKVLTLKKKLFQQIMTASEDLGDPTDPDTGWVCHFKKVKTGSQAYNIEYQLQPLKCKSTPLTDAERLLVEESKPIDEILPRETPESQEKRLSKILNSTVSDEIDPTVESEIDID